MAVARPPPLALADVRRRALRHRFQSPARTVLTIDAHHFRHLQGDCGCEDPEIQLGLPCSQQDTGVSVVLQKTAGGIETLIHCKDTLRPLESWPDDSTTHTTAQEIRQAYEADL